MNTVELAKAIAEDVKKTGRLTNKILIQIYGYDISYPGFKNIALRELELLGFYNAKERYDEIVEKEERKWSNHARKALQGRGAICLK